MKSPLIFDGIDTSFFLSFFLFFFLDYVHSPQQKTNIGKRERGDHFEDTGWDKIKTIGWKTGKLKINLQVYDYSFQSLR